MKRHELAGILGAGNRGQHRNRKRLRRCALEPLETRLALAAAFLPGNILVSNAPFDQQPMLFEYAPTGGTPLQSIPLTHPSNVATERPRDLVFDGKGRVQIYNGTFDPRLTTYDPSAAAGQEFSHTRFPFWNTGNATTYGGLAGLGDFMFATDMKVRAETESTRGLVRFNVENLKSGWSREASADIGDLTGNTSTTIPHVTVHGTGDGSFDYYSFIVPVDGARGIFDIDRADTGNPGSFYSYLRLYDRDHNILSTTSLTTPITAGAGGSTSNKDAYIEYTFAKAGTYLIEVGACCGPNGVPAGTTYDLNISIDNHSEYVLGGSGVLNDVEPNDTLFSPQNTDSGERFGAANGDPIDVAVGLDGLVYALVYTGNSSGAAHIVQVYDPSNLQLLRTVTLPFAHRGIAVDAAGDIYTTFPQIYHYSPQGVPLSVLSNPTEGILGDIDIKPEGCFAGQPSDSCIAVASTNGDVVLTNSSFTDVDFFHTRTGDGTNFVAFVTPPLTLPHATNDVYRIDEDTNGNTLNVLINDLVDSRGKLVITNVGAASAGGVVSISGGASLRYSPAPNVSGSETFTYTVSDMLGGSSTATVTVEVSNVNEPPTANPDGYTLPEDSPPTLLSPLDNDTTAPDLGETLTLVAVGAPDQGGAVSINGNQTTVTYTPAPNFTGNESFTYTIDDGTGTTAVSTVTVMVLNSNDPPTATDDQFAVNPSSSNNPLDVLQNDSAAPDPGETISIVAVGTPSHGTAENFGGSIIRYTPIPGYEGGDSFIYQIQDSNGSQATATVTLSVTVVNLPPTANPDSYQINRNSQNNSLPVLANDSFAPDVNETLTIVNVTSPNHGGAVSIVNNRTSIRYTPSLGYEGPEQFQYTISDGHGGQATATVSITIGLFNSTPVPELDGYLIRQNSTNNVLNVLVNDFDPDGNGLVVISTGATSSGGTAVVAADGGSVVYAPPRPFLGIETFTYTVSDGLGGTASTLVTIEVRGWQNPADPLDTNNDTFVAPPDALFLINELNSPTLIAANGQLPLAPPVPFIYYDVNGDGFLSPGDVLLIINALNAAAGEGEFGVADLGTVPVGSSFEATMGPAALAVGAARGAIFDANVLADIPADEPVSIGAAMLTFEDLIDELAADKGRLARPSRWL